MKFFISNNADSLRKVLAQFERTATVEAEYGDEVVTGTIVTMAHHGPRANDKAPCMYDNFVQVPDIQAVGLSHIDLDTVVGCAALLGRRDPAKMKLWGLVEFADLNGLHKIDESQYDAETLHLFYGMHHICECNRMVLPTSGTVEDISELVQRLTTMCEESTDMRAALEQAFYSFVREQTMLNQESYLGMFGGVIVRVSPRSVNHLYKTPDGKNGKIVVAFNTASSKITVSLSEAMSNISAIDIATTGCGEGSGGRPTVAGSPRGQKMTLNHLVRTRDAAVDALLRQFAP